jgi:hypothetical protein
MKYIKFVCGIETPDLLFIRLIVRLVIYDVDNLIVRLINFNIEDYNLWYWDLYNMC